MELHKWYRKKQYCQGPLDFPCKEAAARELEVLLKDAEQAGLSYQRTFLTVPEFDCAFKGSKPNEAGLENEHTALITATTPDVDRDNEVVLAKGIDRRLFRQNPVIAFAHKYDEMPIGHSLWEKIEDDVLKSFMRFASRPESHPEQAAWFPDTCYELAKQKVLKGVSIGFLPLEASGPTEKEIKANPSLAACRKIIRKSMLLEISLCPIGCNPSALIEQVKGITAEELHDRYGFELPEVESLEKCWVWDTEDAAVEAVELVPTIKQPSRSEMLRKILASKN